MVKRLIPVLFSIVCLAHPLFAQKPTILSVDKSNGGFREVVTLKGNNFGIDKTKLKVMFGAVSGEIKEIGNQLLEVRTPAGTTYDNISVTNTTTRLTGYSPSSYSLNFNGVDALAPAAFGATASQSDFAATSGLYDLCLCDFNGDGKTDVGSASDNSNFLRVFENISTIGSVALTAAPPGDHLIQAKSLHSTCGDLNGDGLPDMVVSEANDGDHIYIFRNTGGFTFDVTILKITGRKVKRVIIADLDLNGKPELVITDKNSNTVTNSSIITVLPNTSTLPTSITFGAAVNITVPGAANTDALEIKDVNGNGLPDIVTSQFLTDLSNIFICDNKSSPGAFNFSDITTLSVSNTIVNIRVGDLDGDSKPDIAATRLIGNDIVVFQNVGIGSQIAFSAPVAFATNESPWGLDFGDLDGDGRPDIAVATIGHTSLTILVNQSVSGTIAFKPMLIVPTNFINRHVRIGDIDGDAKPDLVFTSVDDNKGNPIVASQISVRRNQSCFVPVATPPGPLEVCTGFPLELISSVSGGVTYDWKKNGSPELSGPDASLDVTVSGGYTVTAISEGGACSKTSNTVNVTVTAPSGAITPGSPITSSNTPVCTDDVLNLTVNASGATKFEWSGPDGFFSTSVTPSRSGFTLEKAGVYIVKIFSGNCVALTDSTIVEGIDNPDFSVTFSGEALICQGSSKTLTVSPVLTSGFSYQWFEQTQGELTGETNSTLIRTTSGNYYAQVTSAHPGCSPIETGKINLTAVALPVAAFTPSASPVCVNQVITFANQSTVDPAATPSYKWTFGDAKPGSTEISPEKSYTTASTFPVKLVVTYQGGECPDDETKMVTVTASPAISITAANNFKVCTGDTLRLGVTGDTFSQYEWSTGATTPTILIEEAVEYSVTVTTSAGCILEVKQAITEIVGPTVIVTAKPGTVKVNDKTQLHAEGLESFLWQPGLSLNDSTIANPTAIPLQDIVYTVSGRDENGCWGEASIEIKVLGTSVFDLLEPMRYFSPNGDNNNPEWEIEKIESFPTCEVTIYNDKGSKVYESKPFVSWDGTYKGSKLPVGVYYYVIRCDGESQVKTGSITMLK
jgi:gliding motility-associated-like protein